MCCMIDVGVVLCSMLQTRCERRFIMHAVACITTTYVERGGYSDCVTKRFSMYLLNGLVVFSNNVLIFRPENHCTSLLGWR